MSIVLLRPIITEKSMKLAQSNLYTFEVVKNATKPQVAKAVADKFNVKVLRTGIINVKSKLKAQKRARKVYKMSGFKKALVQLGKGEKIALFETPKEDKEVTVTTAEGEPIKLKEKKDILGRTKVRIEKTAVGAAQTTQRKVITGK